MQDMYKIIYFVQLHEEISVTSSLIAIFILIFLHLFLSFKMWFIVSLQFWKHDAAWRCWFEYVLQQKRLNTSFFCILYFRVEYHFIHSFLWMLDFNVFERFSLFSFLYGFRLIWKSVYWYNCVCVVCARATLNFDYFAPFRLW